MNYGEIRTQFKDILNRRDCSDTLADTFLTQGMQRAQRELRTPPQEKQTSVTVADPWTGFPVPNDVIEVIGFYAETTGGDTGITYLPLKQFLETDNVASGVPLYWTRLGATYQFKPTPNVDLVLTLYYYGEFEAFTGDNDETILSLIAPDLLIYAGLSYAADYFLDERSGAFEGRYGQILQALQMQAYDADGSGQIQPAYRQEY